ncbi:MAG: DUF1398 domain-containing protein [Sphingobacteriales bacterium]|nr:MAG: DUF1398 domain-containing protein [Sphingobacteriales bacterium]
MPTNNFTLQQIADRHALVKSGADFPAYIKDLKQMGVTHYTTYVSDGHTNYRSANGHELNTDAKYDVQDVATISDAEHFKRILKEHQHGMSDYPTFCRQCAEYGVDNWMVDMHAMTCIYYDTSGKQLLTEVIPS